MDVKINSLCRTCLKKDSNLYSVFGVYNENLTYDYIITDVTGIVISTEENDLPTLICKKCKEDAVCAFEFRHTAKNTDMELRKLLEIRKTRILPLETTCQEKKHDIKTEHNNCFSSLLDVNFDSPEYLGDDLGNVKLEEQESCGFRCTKCNLNLGSVEEINQHFVANICDKHTVKEPNSLCCTECGFLCDTSSLFNAHLDSHKNRFMNKKNLRSKKALADGALDDNEQNVQTEKSTAMFKCSFCEITFGSILNLKLHLNVHEGIKIMYCNVCKKMYLKREEFEKHSCLTEKSTCFRNEIIPTEHARDYIGTEILLQNILLTPFVENEDIIQVCTVCSGILLSEEALMNHIDIEHPEYSQKCNRCKKTFASTKTAARHRKKCKQVEKKYACNTCGERFAYEISLNKHILRNHEGQSVSVKFMDTKTRMQERQFQCDTCNKCFYRKELLAKHTKIHMPNEKFFECEVCEKRFHRRDNLKSHKRVHEIHKDKTDTSNCLCLYCGRSFSNSSNLIVHMRRHTGEKPYKCDFCGKGFPRSSDLKWHRRSHTGEKPCVCRICNKRFSRSNKLTRHMRIHTGQKPFKCTYCEKAFAQSYDLTLHIRRHTGDKPYICEVCGDRFIQGNALQNHRRVHGHFPKAETAIESQQDHGVSFTVVQAILQ